MASDGDRSLGEQASSGRPTGSFKEFLAWLRDHGGGEGFPGPGEVGPLELFSAVEKAPISEEDLSLKLSEFSGLPHVARIAKEEVEFKTLARPYCQAKLVVPVRSVGSRQTVVLSNPFDWELLEDLERTLPKGKRLALLLASPETLRSALESDPPGDVDDTGRTTDPDLRDEALSEGPSLPEEKGRVHDPEKDPGRDHPLAKLAVALLAEAVREGATELSIEPRGSACVARADIGGGIRDLKELPLEVGKRLVSRFKALSEMDLAKRRTPQTGGLEILLLGETFKLRLSTTPTSAFETLTVRVLNPSAEAKELGGLGLSRTQAKSLAQLALREEGLILFVGPLGSGKTTTIYSLLSAVAPEGRSVVTVEDPIEHKIPFAVQQEVGADATARVLLERAVLKNPDVLFLSAIRDLVSARTCVDLCSSGLLTLTSMNSTNVATAIFRLERLGVTRSEIADCLIGIVAQRLLKRLCPDCREIRPTSREELALLRPFTADVPESVAHPVGCSSCRGSGYQGQEGVFAVVPVDSRLSDLIREGRPIGELREFAQGRGDLLVSDHAIQKIQQFTFPVQDVYRGVLLEESAFVGEEAGSMAGADFNNVEAETQGMETVDWAAEALITQPSILVVEDEEGTRVLLDQILSRAGYRVIEASDGGEALLKLGSGEVDLVLSDIHMPNLGGLQLLEILNQHGIDTPVILLTGEPSPDVEARGLEMGVKDYLRKPIQRDVLLERIGAVLGRPPA